jgi:hypothetical protein
MSTSHTRLLENDEGLRLVNRLVAGDKTATAELAAAFVQPLIEWLIQTNSKAHPDDCCAAADEAIVNLLRNPAIFDPSQRELFPFLQMAAQGDLRNLIAREQRHRRHRKDFSAVELGEDDGKYLGRENDPAFGLRLAEMEQETIPPAVLQGSTDIERQVLELMQSGERQTSRFAEVMGIVDLPKLQQEREVKKTKDRLKKRLERADGGFDGSS